MNKNRIFLLAIAALLLFGRGPAPFNSDDEIFLYRAAQKIEPNHLPLNQGRIGTCVAVGHAGALDVLAGVKKAAGKLSKWLPASAESIYGLARNEGTGRINESTRDGSSGVAATRALSKYGLIYEQPYPQFSVDLSEYDVKRAKDWGANGNGGRPDGMDGPLDQEAKKHPVKSARVTSLEELDAALKNGNPVTVCSGIGFDSPRDADGFCARRGRWSHCMFVAAKRNGGRKGYLLQNSWGAYIKGDGPNSTNKYKDQPDGSFYIEPQNMQAILDAKDSWALTDVDGFKPSILPDWFFDADAAAPAELARHEPTPDPISDNAAARNRRVYQGRDGSWQFDEYGKHYQYRGGHWYQCNPSGCRRVSARSAA